MISKHSAHSTLLPIGFRTWLRRYTCLLLLISMLWHRQGIFESKGDKLSCNLLQINSIHAIYICAQNVKKYSVVLLSINAPENSSLTVHLNKLVHNLCMCFCVVVFLLIIVEFHPYPWNLLFWPRSGPRTRKLKIFKYDLEAEYNIYIKRSYHVELLTRNRCGIGQILTSNSYLSSTFILIATS